MEDHPDANNPYVYSTWTVSVCVLGCHHICSFKPISPNGALLKNKTILFPGKLTLGLAKLMVFLQ